MTANKHLYTVILAGGGGTRLWPKSREAHPKQFLKLLGEKTMIQITAERARLLSDWEQIIVVTNQAHVSAVKEQLPDLPVENIIAEPTKKDTALAMLTGALYAYSLDPEAIVVNCAADHIVLNYQEYKEVMNVAQKVAADNVLVTVGIDPAYPEVGFGYIKIGQQLSDYSFQLPVFKVSNFTEKPNLATAKAFLATGQYFWNANMYVWSAQALFAAFAKYQPKTYQLVEPFISSPNTTKFIAQLGEIYQKADSISIDYAISEKADNLVLIPGNFDWSDIGDWKVVHQLNQKDLDENVYLSAEKTIKVLPIASHNNMIYANNRLIALYGVDDLVVIDTPEILMIIPKSESQNVKKIVEEIKEKKKKEYL